MTRNMIFFSSQKQFFSKELAIAKPAKYIWTTGETNLAVLLSMQIFLRTWQEHWLVNNLAQLPTQWKFLFSCTVLVQNHTQVAESLVFTNLEIGIFCTVQEPSWLFLISYKSKTIFIFSLFYDPFYCNMICFTAVFKIITAVATCSYWLPIFSLCFCPEPREGKHVSVRPNSTIHPLSIIAKL